MRDFYRVLTEAIEDFSEHGFDSAERLERWVRELKESAKRSLIPKSMLERMLRDALTKVYQRSVEGSGLRKTNPDVAAYTIQQIKPQLRAELDRRILASANLITLNRDASIEKTLQRFTGWATAIPIGGSDAIKRRESKDAIRRGISGLRFEDRRVLVDQGHKLSASLSEIVAKDGRAIAGTWHHVKEGGGYQARPEHVARDNHVYVVRGNWALREGFMKLAGHQYYDEITAAASEPFCRCWITWIHNLRGLPAEMLTDKGRTRLDEVHRQINLGNAA